MVSFSCQLSITQNNLGKESQWGVVWIRLVSSLVCGWGDCLVMLIDRGCSNINVVRTIPWVWVLNCVGVEKSELNSMNACVDSSLLSNVDVLWVAASSSRCLWWTEINPFSSELVLVRILYLAKETKLGQHHSHENIS